MSLAYVYIFLVLFVYYKVLYIYSSIDLLRLNISIAYSLLYVEEFVRLFS